jgi:MSHA biogenesis protein MshK
MKVRPQSFIMLLCGAICVTAVTAAWAQSLTDPTRPPSAFGSSGSADSAPEASSLQSIIRSNVGKPAAIINGEYVVLGGRVGDATLVKIGEDSVTLKTATGSETLMLIPGVEKKPAAEGKEAKKMRRNRDEVKK